MDNKQEISIQFDDFLDKLEEHWRELNKLKNVEKEKTRVMSLISTAMILKDSCTT
jgi:hypothetical protein